MQLFIHCFKGKIKLFNKLNEVLMINTNDCKFHDMQQLPVILHLWHPVTYAVFCTLQNILQNIVWHYTVVLIIFLRSFVTSYIVLQY